MSEPLKPVLDTVVTSGAVHFYISQSDKGELVMGGDIDGYNSYGQRSNLPALEHVVQSMVALFPSFSRLRMMRTWGGVMDMSMDGSPIIGKIAARQPVSRLRLVLRRLQGHPRLRLVLRAHHRERRAASLECRLYPRSLCARHDHRRKRRRAVSVGALEAVNVSRRT